MRASAKADILKLLTLPRDPRRYLQDMTRRHTELIQRLTPHSPQPLFDTSPRHSPASLFAAAGTRQALVMSSGPTSIGHSPSSLGHSPPLGALQSAIAAAAAAEQSGQVESGGTMRPPTSSVTEMVRSWATGSKDADKLLEWAKVYEQRRVSSSDMVESHDLHPQHAPSLFPPGSNSLFPRQPPEDSSSCSSPEGEAGKALAANGWAVVGPGDGSSMSSPWSRASTHRRLGPDGASDTGHVSSMKFDSQATPLGLGQQQHHPSSAESSLRDTVLLKSQSGRVEASFELSPRYFPHSKSFSSPTISHGSEPHEPIDLAPIDHEPLDEYY